VHILELAQVSQLAEQARIQALSTKEYFELHKVHSDDDKQDVHPVGQLVHMLFAIK
jgi:hypothetical protein